jgi:hypothetical protein
MWTLPDRPSYLPGNDDHYSLCPPGTLEHRGGARRIIGIGGIFLAEAKKLLVGDGSGSESVGGSSGSLHWPKSSAIKEGLIPIPWNRFSIFYGSTRNWRFS